MMILILINSLKIRVLQQVKMWYNFLHSISAFMDLLTAIKLHFRPESDTEIIPLDEEISSFRSIILSLISPEAVGDSLNSGFMKRSPPFV